MLTAAILNGLIAGARAAAMIFYRLYAYFKGIRIPDHDCAPGARRTVFICDLISSVAIIASICSLFIIFGASAAQTGAVILIASAVLLTVMWLIRRNYRLTDTE